MNLKYELYELFFHLLLENPSKMKRRGAYDGQLLSLEGTYELASRSESVRISDTPECVWSHEMCRAIVTKERGKHLLLMGVRLRQAERKIGLALIERAPEGLCKKSKGAVISRPKRTDDINEFPDSYHENESVLDASSTPVSESKSQPSKVPCPSGGPSQTPLALFPEEALLLVEQGAIIMR